MKKDKTNFILWSISRITTFLKDGHGDSMINPAQRAESVLKNRIKEIIYMYRQSIMLYLQF